MSTHIVRKAHTGEAGNPGQFGRGARGEAPVDLAAPPHGAQAPTDTDSVQWARTVDSAQLEVADLDALGSCPACSSGELGGRACPVCQGSGAIYDSRGEQRLDEATQRCTFECPDCRGEGALEDRSCRACDGVGTITDYSPLAGEGHVADARDARNLKAG